MTSLAIETVARHSNDVCISTESKGRVYFY